MIKSKAYFQAQSSVMSAKHGKKRKKKNEPTTRLKQNEKLASCCNTQSRQLVKCNEARAKRSKHEHKMAAGELNQYCIAPKRLLSD